MKLTPTPMCLAIATAFGTAAAFTAHAADITFSTGPVNFSATRSATDTCGTVNTVDCDDASATNPGTMATPLLGQFNASTGVLLGTTIQLNSSRTQTISGGVTDGTVKTKTTSATETFGDATSKAEMSAPGVSSGNLGTLNIDGKATVTSGTSATFGPTSDKASPTITSQIVPSANLNSYVGGGTVTVTLAAPSLAVDSTFKNGIVDTTKSSASYTLGWDGSVSADYTYQLHAAPSFASGSPAVLSLDLDFGTLFLNDAAADIPFSIFNLAGDRVGLDLDSIIGLGDVTKLTTNLSLFTNLDQGSDLDYLASLDTSSLGSFAASYTLCFSDEDVGASASRYDCTIDPDSFLLTLNLTGRVVERIPEPATLGLLGIGLAGLAWRRRRR